MDAQRHPEAYGFEHVEGAEEAEAAHELAKSKGSLLHIKPKHVFAKAANHLYDHPFQLLITLSAPIIGGLFYTEMQKPGA